MSTSTEAAQSAVKDNYVPESTIYALLEEMAELRQEIKRLKKANQKNQVIINYLENRQ